MRFKQIVVSLLAALLSATVSAIYADEKGKNEWVIQNIGEVVDAVFIGGGRSYMLSDDNLLSYFNNTASGEAQWRKQLPTNDGETYQLRHMDMSLVAYSSERALMVTTQGDVQLEVPLVGSGKIVVEMFKDGADLFVCFVRQDRVQLYKNGKPHGAFQISSEVEDMPDDFQETF